MDAILLAAGNSVRFGGNKLLYRLNGKPVYRYILELLDKQKQAGVFGHVIVVSQYEEIFKDIRDNFPGIEAVKNPAPELGISSSIRIGLTYLERMPVHAQACLFTVADQPGMTEESLVKAVRFWQANTCGIVAASHKGQIGNPVIFAAKYYEELKRLEGDAGGKKVLRKHLDDTGLYEIPVCELADLDTADDARSFLENQVEQRNYAGDDR